jgi:hypothetical protein
VCSAGKVTISTKLAQDFKVHGNEGDRQISHGSGMTRVEIPKFYIGDRRLHISAQEDLVPNRIRNIHSSCTLCIYFSW